MQPQRNRDTAAVNTALFRDFYQNGTPIKPTKERVFDLMEQGVSIKREMLIDKYRAKYLASYDAAKVAVTGALKALEKQKRVKHLSTGIWERI